ncbi:hypothetical protein QBC39DRAFT_352673 [Podospora conica]|nr:hypothetical protein QBC39DRAFT_352673 [Schizothecium conicum]
MGDSLPPPEAPASGEKVKLVPQGNDQPPIADSSTSPTVPAPVVPAKDKSKTLSQSFRTTGSSAAAFLSSTLSTSKLGSRATGAPSPNPAAQAPDGREAQQTSEGGKGKEPEVEDTLRDPLQIFSQGTEHYVDIIAVHDLGELAKDAWTYWPDADELAGAGVGESNKETTNRKRRNFSGNVKTRKGSTDHAITHFDTAVSPQNPANAPMPQGKNSERSKHAGSNTNLLNLAQDETGDPRSPQDQASRKDVNWLRDLLNHDIRGSRILAFSYGQPDSDNKDFTWEGYVNKTAEGLLRHIQQVRPRTSGRRRIPVVFVGYGFGGIIIQRAVEHALRLEQSKNTKTTKRVENTTCTEPAGQSKQTTGNTTSNSTKKPPETKEKGALVARDIYQVLFLDTPFPQDDKFPANMNVRMCDIIKTVENKEKDSKILDDVWEGFSEIVSKSFPERCRVAPEGFNQAVSQWRTMNLTWLHSQATPKQSDGRPAEQVNTKVSEIANIAINMTSVSISTMRHRLIARISAKDDYIYQAILSRIQSTLLFQCIEMGNTDFLTAILRSNKLTILKEVPGNFTPLHAALQMDPPNEEVVAQLVDQMQSDIVERDDNGQVPLHHALYTASKTMPRPEERTLEDRYEFRNSIRRLMRNMQRTDFNIKDKHGKSPWDLLKCKGSAPDCECDTNECASGAAWIKELRDDLEPIGGPEIQDEEKIQPRISQVVKGTARWMACLNTDGTLAEFYWAPNAQTGKLQECINLRTPSIYRMIYDPKQGLPRFCHYQGE